MKLSIMQGTKLINFVSLLDKIGLNRFRDFVSSPYFNKNQQIIELVDFLVKQKNQKRIEFLQTQDYQKIFKQSPPKSFNFSRLQNQTLQLFYKFLAQEATNSRDIWNSLRALDTALTLKESKLVEEIQKKVEKKIHQKAEILDYYLAASYLKTKEDINWLKKGIISLDSYRQAIEYMDIMYILSQLNLYSAVISLENYRYQKIEELADPNFMRLLRKYEHIPIVKGKTLAFSLLIAPNEENYEELKKLLEQQKDELQGKDLLFLVSALLRYVILGNHHSDNDPNMLRETKFLYSFLIKHKVYFRIGNIDKIDYINIVNVYIHTGDLEDAKYFAKNHMRLLDVDIQESIYHLMQAEILFTEGALDHAEGILLDTDCPRGSLHVAKQHLLIRIYYEELKWRLLLSTLESLRIYVSRNTVKSSDISSDKKVGIYNFISVTKKLVKLNYCLKDELGYEIRKLKQKLEGLDIVWKKKWLLDKIVIWEAKA
ncbi:MAG: hypothetical protein MK212_04200 [Saprospiraceae bacterium]|nr:hypothetical protein [Saprospiraceae bacterium]